MLRRISRWMGSKRSMTHVNIGNTAPVFSLKGLDGKDYSLPTLLKRGPVVAAFFKISCPVCQFTFPFLERLYKRYGGGRGALGVNFSASARGSQSIPPPQVDRSPTALDPNAHPAP